MSINIDSKFIPMKAHPGHLGWHSSHFKSYSTSSQSYESQHSYFKPYDGAIVSGILLVGLAVALLFTKSAQSLYDEERKMKVRIKIK